MKRIPWNKGLTKESDKRVALSEETKQKMRESHVGKPLSEEHVDSIRLSRIGTHLSEETKQKIGNSNRGKIRSDDFKKRISEVTSGKNNPRYGVHLSEEQKNKYKEKRKTWSVPYEDSSIELAMQNILIQNNIEFEKHKRILGTPDLFIKPNLCIFCDSIHFHIEIDRTSRDKYVTDTLQSQGYKVLRFWDFEITDNLDGCLEVIKREL